MNQVFILCDCVTNNFVRRGDYEAPRSGVGSLPAKIALGSNHPDPALLRLRHLFAAGSDAVTAISAKIDPRHKNESLIATPGIEPTSQEFLNGLRGLNGDKRPLEGHVKCAASGLT